MLLFDFGVCLCVQNPEEDSYYYEYPYYDELGGKHVETASEAEGDKEEKVRVVVLLHLFWYMIQTAVGSGNKGKIGPTRGAEPSIHLKISPQPIG